MAAMKMAPAHFEALKAAIEPLDTEVRREQYREGRFLRAERVDDLQVRYRWDLLWASGGHEHFRSAGMYDDHRYSTAHIDTALRKIVPALAEPHYKSAQVGA